MTPQSRRLARKLATLGAIVAAAAFGLALSLSPPTAPTEITLPEAACSLNQGPCTHTLPNGVTVRFSITPHPVPVLEDIHLDAGFDGPPPDHADVDLNGVTMKMAPNRPTLARATDGHYRATTALAICITGAMQWQAILALDYGATRYLLPFTFDAGHRN
ncbi:MAG: hypothetical protein KDF24_10315 [Rhodocyclaceae bacterium]|nr:hypothetical protein [Rhodocyclaceae bacterium]